MSTSVHLLRQLVYERFPDAHPIGERDAHATAPCVPTGFDAIDRILPGHGLPRGKLTAWAPTGGAAALLRASSRALVHAGERAAWVDASGTVSFGWAATPAVGDAAPLIVRVTNRRAALSATRLLARSGAFALVVLDGLDGADAVGGEVAHLVRAARDGGTALVATTNRGSMAALRVQSRLRLDGVRWRRNPFGEPAMPIDVRVDVSIRTLGWSGRAVVQLVVAAHDFRCALAPGGIDRRGGAIGSRPPLKRRASH